MAKLEYVCSGNKVFPESTEAIEVRVWSTAGVDGQPFYIGTGANTNASGTLWLEIIYSVEDAQIFYTRNFMQHEESNEPYKEQLDELLQKGEGSVRFGEFLPETSITLIGKKHTYKDEKGKEKEYQHCELEISIDTSTVFGRTGPGLRTVDLKIHYVELEEGVRFIRDFIQEIDDVRQGRHPDPASLPVGSCEWPLVWQLNQRAYNRISETYVEHYFKNPLLETAFGDWLAMLPRGGHILDAGCGHGRPVIDRLLEKGFQVTGSDFSSEMLRRAGRQFPQATFIQQATTSLTCQAAFDGACSFNSVLYLDPIDLLNSIYRLHNALKPGGLLFLYGFDTGPSWRGEPFNEVIGQLMWTCHYGMEEAAGLLEEHGYFEVLETRKVFVDPNEEQRIAQELEKQKQAEEEYNRRQAGNPEAFSMPFYPQEIERSPYAYTIVARRCER